MLVKDILDLMPGQEGLVLDGDDFTAHMTLGVGDAVLLADSVLSAKVEEISVLDGRIFMHIVPKYDWERK